MAKRFIDTKIFESESFSALSKDEKIFFIYFITNCDHAGVLKLNKRLCEFQTGIDQNSLGTVVQGLGNRLIKVGEGLCFFMPKFLTFQYPNFPNSRVAAQVSAINILKSLGFTIEKLTTLTQGLSKPYEYGNENGYDNGNGYVLPVEEIKNVKSEKSKRFTPEQIQQLRSQNKCPLPDDYPVEWEKYVPAITERERYCTEKGVVIDLLPESEIMAMPSEVIREYASQMWALGADGYARQVGYLSDDKLKLERQLEEEEDAKKYQ